MKLLQLVTLGLAATIGLLFAQPGHAQSRSLATILEAAEALEPLRTVTVARNGEIVAERTYNGADLDAPTNIKSASKSVLSALIGIAIDRGILESADQPIADFLEPDFPPDPDPRLYDITIGNLLSMQAGLEATSGANYGRWIASGNWVRSALGQAFVDTPGGSMIYSTGSSHLLSAILSTASGSTALDLARDWLSPLEDFAITGWHRDPQGIYLGGNQMAMTPHALLSFGELYRNHGMTAEGEQILSSAWIEQSWQPRTQSRRAGSQYGYGWFLDTFADHEVSYAWGYGGQMLYIVPDLGLTVVMTSDPSSPSAGNGHRDDLHALLTEIVAETAAHP